MPALHFKIESDRVTLRPKSWLIIMAIVLTIPFGGVIAISVALPELGRDFALMMGPFTLVAIGIPFLLSRQKAVFDARSSSFYRSLFNVRLRTIAFSQIDAVTAIPVRGISAGEYFRLVVKGDRYGGGVRLSRTYLVTSRQYITWVKEIMPVISQMIRESVVPPAPEPVLIPGTDDFRFYKPVADGYRTFTRSAMGRFTSALLAVMILLGGCLAVTKPGRGSDMLFGIVIILVAVIILMSLTNRITITKKEICKSQLMGLIKTKRSTENFMDFSTLRRSTNSIYNGTDVFMNFHHEKAFSLRSFYRTRKIERFLAETKMAMSQD